ncbi:RICIN domain-containing protein [Catellatospora sichuanensis]|uniref:RICIN domain-containing protein n=1 Tax=Catellatospora sichuanensis TaxID=1969805 RepID=UPI001FE737A6|nr:RICIN domain-containing protein [Catellatospora sichuanensis]
MHLRTRLVAAAAATATLTAVAAVVTAGAAQAVAGPTVSSWITTPDRTQLLAAGSSLTFNTDGTRPGTMIDVNAAQTFQAIDGFGASITDSSAALLYGLPAAQRDQVMRSLFSPGEGIGMSFLRQPIGASDFVSGPHYTYNDLPSGQTDLNQTRFSIAHDEARILPLLRQALQLNPGLKIMASPWSQPAWMKTNNSLAGGRIKDDPAYFRSWALYLVKFVQAYQAAGVPIYALTVQNEPQNRTPDNYPGTDLPVAHQDRVIGELGPMLQAAGLGHVKIISYDHNWSLHPDDAADAQRLGYDPEPNYPYDALRGPAAQWIDGTGYHHYAGDAGAQNNLHNAFPDKDIWFTEGSGWRGAADPFAQYFADTLKWHARNIHVAAVRNWARGVLNWNLALNSQGGPVNGGCGSNPDGMCTGVVTIDGTTVTRNAEYYTIGHMSRFVRPGAVRIGSNNAGDLHNVAMRNTDGSISLVVTNISGDARQFGIAYNGMFVAAALPGGAVATYTWNGSAPPSPSAPPSASPSASPSARPSTSPSASPSQPSGPCPVSETAYYRITSVHSGKALDVRDASTGNGAGIQQWDYFGNSNQQWRFTATGGGYYRIAARHSGKVLDVKDVSTADGAGVQQWDYAGGANQQWQLLAAGGGTCRIVARHSGKALDVKDVSTADGAGIQQWSYTGAANQRWTFTAVS